jgi:GT2 family glycosyltransferase
MVSHGIREDIGCVGSKLLYKDNTVQHGGIILGLGGVAGHALRKFPNEYTGQFSKLQLVQNYLAVTGACLLIRTKVFKEVSGFNEIDLKVAFNDVDLSLKVVDAGYRNVWTPFAQLYHYESASRGDDLTGKKLERFSKEAKYIIKHWSKYLKSDPYYNQNLTLEREDFSLGRPRLHG